MSRSGTSLTARVLNLLGVDLGPETGLIGPGPRNERGFWERHDFYELNEAILATLGGDYLRPPSLPDGWESSERLDPLRRKARRLLDDVFGDRALWGFKDPRASLTLPFWRALIPDLRSVICVRDPVEVNASFAPFLADAPADAVDAEEHWALSTASALVNSHGTDRIVVFYSSYFDDLERQIDALAEFVGRPAGADVRRRIRAFVDASQRHHRASARRSNTAAEQLWAELVAVGPFPTSEEIHQVEQSGRAVLIGAERRRGTGLAGPPVAEPPRAPAAVRRFPHDLFAQALDYEGIDRDGWLRESAHLVLAGGARDDLILCARVPEIAEQHLEVTVDGVRQFAGAVPPGLLHLRLPLAPSPRARRVELRWRRTRPLAPDDARAVSALLRFVRIIRTGDVDDGRAATGGGQPLAEAVADELGIVDELVSERDQYARVASERLDEIHVLTKALAEREAALATLRSIVDERGHELATIAAERDAQANAAAERLEALRAREGEHRRETQQLRTELDVLRRIAHDRHAALERAERQSTNAQNLVGEQLRQQAREAAERLSIIDEVVADRDLHAAVAAERLSRIERLSADLEELREERDRQAAAAAERMSDLAALEADRDLNAAASAERLNRIERLSAELEEVRAERDRQAAAAAERLSELEAIAADRDAQRAAAEERDLVIRKLARELEEQADAARQRLQAMETIERSRDPRHGDLPRGWR